jgi:hypothetical protein
MRAIGASAAGPGAKETGVDSSETLNKSILDFSAPAIGKTWFSDGSQDQQLTAADLGSASLRCGKR